MEIDERTLYTRIGERLRARRRELRLTQQQLALRLGVERSSVANLEGGAQRSPVHLLYRYCLVLGVALDEVLPPLDTVTVATNSNDVSTTIPPKTAALVHDLLSALAGETP